MGMMEAAIVDEDDDEDADEMDRIFLIRQGQVEPLGVGSCPLGLQTTKPTFLA